MATKTASAKPYDPVKAMEGMFNGSVTRIAQALRDPVNYGASTKTVLTEAAKRFHDALDDCEVQLLDAKWYLEDQIEQNRLRREAKARELGTAAKRKHDAISEATSQEETPTKKPKIEEEKETAASSSTMTAPAAKPVESAMPNSDGPMDTKKQDPPKAKPTAETPVQDDFAEPTPQASPAVTNEDFNFESMFGDTNTNGADNDLGFDLGLDTGFDESQDPTALGTLVPDLDDFTAQPPGNTTTATNADALPAFSNDFDLPEIGGTNAFDDFLNDDSLGGNLGDNIDMSDQALLNMEFDDKFFN